MNSYFLLAILILSIASCQNQQNQTNVEVAEENANSTVTPKPAEEKISEPELIESFSDDKKIGIARKNKIEMSQLEGDKDNFVVIKFYSLEKNKEWKLKQSFELIKYGGLPFDPQIKDFNNDGFKDLTYVSGIAARGANEIRNLLIYDKKKDELVFIKNSGDYPNLLYNKELNCLDSYIVTGSTETVFLKINGDNLRKIASIQNSEISGRTIYLIDKNGKEKLLRTDKIKADDIFARYKNFNPPKQYEDEELNQQ